MKKYGMKYTINTFLKKIHKNDLYFPRYTLGWYLIDGFCFIHIEYKIDVWWPQEQF